MKNLMKYIVRSFVSLIPKDRHKVMAYIDCNKTNDGLHPYHDDSVYIICERLKEKYPELEVTYFFNKIEKHDPENARKQAKRQFLCCLRAYYVISSDFPIKSYHTKQQKILITGYFTPFKADRYIENYTDVKYGSNYNDVYSKMCRYFDFYNYTYAVSSYYALSIISASLGIPARKMKVLGLARNELLLKEIPYNLKEIFTLSFTPKKVFLFTPTFRDYEYNQLDPYMNDKNVFGYCSNDELASFLKETDSLLLYKPHNLIDVEKGSTIFNENIKLISGKIMEEYKLGSYEFMRMADALICDYSSISFDYLYLHRPIIYNIPDYDYFDKYRGFPIANMKVMMAGEKTTTEAELVKAMKNVLDGNDQYEKQRDIIHSIVNEVPAEGTVDRIIDYFIERGC